MRGSLSGNSQALFSPHVRLRCLFQLKYFVAITQRPVFSTPSWKWQRQVQDSICFFGTFRGFQDPVLCTARRGQPSTVRFGAWAPGTVTRAPPKPADPAVPTTLPHRVALPRLQTSQRLNIQFSVYSSLRLVSPKSSKFGEGRAWLRFSLLLIPFKLDKLWVD